MTGDKTKCIIIDCPFDRRWGCIPFNSGAEFARQEILEMAYDWILPSGTYWNDRGTEYVFYRGLRYVITADGDVDESSASRTTKDEHTDYKLRWIAVTSCLK